MSYRESLLQARVIARNRANAIANDLQPKLIDVFRPLLGEKILKQDGGLMTKVAKLLPEFPKEQGVRVWHHSSTYSLAWCTDVCQHVEGAESCIYEERHFYIGTIDGAYLTELSELVEFRTDYTVEEITELRKTFKQKEKEYEAAKGKLYPFGEGDR